MTTEHIAASPLPRKRRMVPPIADRSIGDYLACGVGVRRSEIIDDAVCVELVLPHLGAGDTVEFDGRTLTFRLLGHRHHEELAEHLEWLAARIRLRGHGLA